MAVLDDMDKKLDKVLEVLSEEVNIHPDTLMPGLFVSSQLMLTTNASVPLSCEFRVEDDEGGRYLVFRLRDAMGYWTLVRRWRAVYRDPVNPLDVVDRPGQDQRLAP